jgi:hypothetical protein
MAKCQYSADSARNPHPLLLNGIPAWDAPLPVADINNAEASSNPFVFVPAKSAPQAPADLATINAISN